MTDLLLSGVRAWGFGPAPTDIAIAGGRIFLRSDDEVVAIGK